MLEIVSMTRRMVAQFIKLISLKQLMENFFIINNLTTMELLFMLGLVLLLSITIGEKL